jgi:hypothetical protein
MEQLQPVGLITEPQRLSSTQAALDHFRSRYRDHYKVHHRAYWAEMASIHARLLEVKGEAEALSKLNTLTGLGPPAGEGALVAYGALLDETSDCSLIVGVEDKLGERAICPACALSLDQEPPVERTSDVLRRIGRAIQIQVARLYSVAVHQVLKGNDNPQLERFLKVIQIVRLSSLAEILDDELMGYLRRFLIESRIRAALDPILDHLGGTSSVEPNEAREALGDMAQVLREAFRPSGRALLSPRAALKGRRARKAAS